MTMPASTTLAPKREGFLPRLLRLRRGPWEWVATFVIATGVIMMMQPISLLIYGWSFATILAGTITFVIVSHFPE
jgi:hypothetical protein